MATDASATGGALESGDGPPRVPVQADWAAGTKQGLLIAAAVLVMVLPPMRQAVVSTAPHPAAAAAVPNAAAIVRSLDFKGQNASPEALQLAQWVVSDADNGTRPFVILDKKTAEVFVFEPGGQLRGASRVLLGYARGDDSVQGIGTRPIAQIRPEERTTPAGRFVAQTGRNALDEDVVWVDYEAAISMHRVRATDPTERRLERLASPTATDKRISYGCINMPVAFFDQVLWPALHGHGGIVYVLPEIKPLTEVFPRLAPRSPTTRVLLVHGAAAGIAARGA